VLGGVWLPKHVPAEGCVKSDEEIMEILEAYDLTGSCRGAAELAGCSHHTVAHYVAAREEGRLTPGRAQPRPMLIDGFLPKVEEWWTAPAGRSALMWWPPSTRRAVADNRLAEIVQVAATTGDDPALDALILRLHIETACRRGGALALRPIDLDPDQYLITLREKGDTTRSQPVSLTLMSQLLAHATERGADTTPSGPLLRYRSGQPINRRRYDYIWTRLGSHLPWVTAQGVSTHWLRHTTLTWVERNFGYAVARASAGHNDRGKSAGTTTTHVQADIDEVAAASPH
jgi:integrase